MSLTRRDLINQTLRILDLSAGTNAGRVDSSDGATSIYSSDQSFTDWLNDGAAECAQTCLPLWDSGAKTGVTGGMIAFTDLTVASGNRLWAVEGNGVTLGSSPVIRGARHWVQASSAGGTSGSPFLYWHPYGQEGIFVTGVPTPSAATLTVFGLAVPKPLAGDTDTFPAAWLKGEDAYTVCLYAAARLAEKRAADGLLGPRAAPLWGMYNERRKAHRDRLGDTEKALLLAFGDGEGG